MATLLAAASAAIASASATAGTAAAATAAAGTTFTVAGTGLASTSLLAGTGALSFTGASAAATTAAIGSYGAFAAGGGALLTTANVLKGVSLATSLAGGLAQYGQAAALAEQKKTAGIVAAAQSEVDLAAGAERARVAAREARLVSGAQSVAFLANGLDIGVGTPMDVQESSRRQADRNLSITRRNARTRAATSRLRSRALNSEARAALTGGRIGAVTQVARIAPVLAA